MPTITLSTLRTRVLDRLDNNTGLYPTPEVDSVINECIRTVALFTGFYRVTLPLAGFTVADQLLYDVPDTLLVVTSILYEDRQLNYSSLKDLARSRRNWATDTTARNGRVDYWAPVGIRQFVITPVDSVGGNDLTLTGIGEPPLLVNASDTMQLENEYVELIPEYCSHRLMLKEGGKVFADASLGLNVFYDKMKERKAYERLKIPKYGKINERSERPL